MTKGYQSQNSCSFSPFILWKERNLQVASFTNCLCFSLSNSPFATRLCRALLSVVYTEDIKWPAFTKILELLLHAEVPLSQRLCREIRRYQRGGGVDKWLWCFSVPKQCRHFGTLHDPWWEPSCGDVLHRHIFCFATDLGAKSNFLFCYFCLGYDRHPHPCDGAVNSFIWIVMSVWRQVTKT